VRPLALLLVLGAVSVVVGGACGVNGSGRPAGEIVFSRWVSGEDTSESLYLTKTDGTQVRLLVRDASDAAVSPDGRLIAFVRDSAIWLMRSDGSSQRGLLPKEGCGVNPTWSPDGRTIYFAGCDATIASIRVDGTGLRQLTHPVAVYVGGGAESVAAHTNPGASPDGRLIVFKEIGDTAHDAQVHLAAISPDGRRVRLPATLAMQGGSQEDINDPAWAPDGRTLAYTFHDIPFDTLTGLYVVSLGRPGSAPRRIATGDASVPAWSPDGEWIAFTRAPSLGEAALWLVRPDGTGLRHVPHVRVDMDGGQLTWLPPAS
jgi:Tol biopolymer transport system component